MSADSVTGSGTDRSLSFEIVEEVAAMRGVPSTELEPLYTVVDPDALENLFADSSRHGRISFEYEGCTVVADSEGRVAVTTTDRAS